MSVSYDGSPTSHRPSYTNGHHEINHTHSTRSSRPSAGRSGKVNVIDLVDSDTDTGKSLKRKASPTHSSEFHGSSTSPYPTEYVPSKHNRASASASPALSALLNGPSSPPLRPRQISPPPNPPQKTPPTSNASLNVPTTRSPPQPKAVTEIAKASKDSSSNSKKSATSAPASGAPSPKPAKAVPVSKGSGLIAGAFGDVSLGDDDPEPSVPTVILQISLNGESNKYINVSKLAEEKYGWAALNPRLARAKARLGQDASGDEAMMDASESESAMEEKIASDVPANGAAPKRKRRKQDEYYDANDPFIDDSEMLWEEQAAASKDGFFVYSGPLVPEGEAPQIERTGGGAKRGRGRGGRASGAGRGGANTTAKAAGPRKPRVTKAVKEKMEREKEERERAGLKVAAAMQAPRSIPA